MTIFLLYHYTLRLNMLTCSASVSYLVAWRNVNTVNIVLIPNIICQLVADNYFRVLWDRKVDSDTYFSMLVLEVWLWLRHDAISRKVAGSRRDE
jgi:hypothetical protein